MNFRTETPFFVHLNSLFWMPVPSALDVTVVWRLSSSGVTITGTHYISVIPRGPETAAERA